jgi:hypothetical protein
LIRQKRGRSKQLRGAAGLEWIGEGRRSTGGKSGGSGLPGCERQQLTITGVQEDDVAAFRPHARQRFIQTSLRNFL